MLIAELREETRGDVECQRYLDLVPRDLDPYEVAEILGVPVASVCNINRRLVAAGARIAKRKQKGSKASSRR